MVVCGGAQASERRKRRTSGRGGGRSARSHGRCRQGVSLSPHRTLLARTPIAVARGAPCQPPCDAPCTFSNSTGCATESAVPARLCKSFQHTAPIGEAGRVAPRPRTPGRRAKPTRTSLCAVSTLRRA
eukprot:240413-Prymnesium_polylepis.1